MRKQIDVNKIVGIKDNEVYVLEYVFDDDGFKGAVGYSMRTLTKQEVEDYRSDTEHLRDIWVEAVKSGHTSFGLDDFAEMANEEAEMYGRYYCGDDDSFRDKFHDLLDELTDDEKKLLPTTDLDWTCCGCGRHFDKDMKFDVVFNREALDLIYEYENNTGE